MANIDPWEAVKKWRAQRARVVGQPSKATYDAYPDLAEVPEIRFYVESRDVKGRLLREYVDLEGYSMHQINWKPGARRGGTTVRDWFVGQMLEALLRLEVRLDEVREGRKQRREFDHDPRTGTG